MKYLKACVILFFLFSVFSADQTSDMYFHLSIQKYLEGNLSGAISDSEQAFNMGGASDRKLTAFYVKILLEQGGKLVNNKQYQDALPYFEKASGVDPGNKEIQSVIGLINKKLKPAENTAVRENSAGADVSSKGSEKSFNDLIKTLQFNQDRLIEKIVQPGKSLETLVARSDAERKDLIKMLANKDNDMVDVVKSQNESMKMIMYLLVAVVIIALLIYFITSRGSSKRESVIFHQQEAILNLMVQQQQALMQGSSMLRLSEGTCPPGEFITPKQMLNDPKPRIRAKGIEIIDAQLVRENEDPEVAARILKPFLEDNDNRVRANSIKILFRYKPEEAVASALEMTKSPDKWMRVSGAWVFGEMEGFELAATLLMEKIDENDYHFKRRALKSLSKLIDPEAKVKLSPEMQEKVKQFIEETANKEQWIV